MQRKNFITCGVTVEPRHDDQEIENMLFLLPGRCTFTFPNEKQKCKPRHGRNPMILKQGPSLSLFSTRLLTSIIKTAVLAKYSSSPFVCVREYLINKTSPTICPTSSSKLPYLMRILYCFCCCVDVGDVDFIRLVDVVPIIMLLLPLTFCFADTFRVYGCKCWSCCSCSPRSRISGVGGEIVGSLHSAVDETPFMEVGDDVSWE